MKNLLISPNTSPKSENLKQLGGHSLLSSFSFLERQIKSALKWTSCHAIPESRAV